MIQQHGEELLLPPGCHTQRGTVGLEAPRSPALSLLSSMQHGQPEWMARVSPALLGVCHHPAFTEQVPTTLLGQQPGQQEEAGEHISSL